MDEGFAPSDDREDVAAGLADNKVTAGLGDADNVAAGLADADEVAAGLADADDVTAGFTDNDDESEVLGLLDEDSDDEESEDNEVPRLTEMGPGLKCTSLSICKRPPSVVGSGIASGGQARSRH